MKTGVYPFCMILENWCRFSEGLSGQFKVINRKDTVCDLIFVCEAGWNVMFEVIFFGEKRKIIPLIANFGMQFSEK